MTPDEPIDPAELDRRCAEVRSKWSEWQEKNRRAVKVAEVVVAEVKVKDMGGVEE